MFAASSDNSPGCLSKAVGAGIASVSLSSPVVFPTMYSGRGRLCAVYREVDLFFNTRGGERQNVAGVFFCDKDLVRARIVF